MEVSEHAVRALSKRIKVPLPLLSASREEIEQATDEKLVGISGLEAIPQSS